MATHSQVDSGFIERFICHFIENVVAQRSRGSRGVKIAVHVSCLIVFFPQSPNPTQQSHTTSNLSLLELTHPRLVTNPLTNSSPTSGLALAVGREPVFISDVSSAFTKQFRSFHRLLTISQVGPTLMFSKSFVVLTPLTNWLLCLLGRMFLFVVRTSPEDTTFLEAVSRLWCLRFVVGAWPRRRCSLPSSSASLRCEFYPDLFVVCTLSHHK